MVSQAVGYIKGTEVLGAEQGGGTSHEAGEKDGGLLGLQPHLRGWMGSKGGSSGGIPDAVWGLGVGEHEGGAGE